MSNIYNSQLDAYSLYHKTQEEQISHTNGPVLPALGHALAGSTGTAISNLAIYPLDLIITRLQVQRQLRKSSTFPEADEYKGVLDAFTQIYNKEGGISAFYVGILQDTGKSIADSFLFFLFYNYMRTRRLQKHGGKATSLPVLDELSVGALAGAFSKFFTAPISNIVTRKQTASMVFARSGSTAAEPSVSDIASQIRTEKGLQGFWSGYSASLVLTLNPSITFFLYEFFKRCLPRSKRDDPSAKITFLMAACSKAIASTITYPFSLAKARAQTSSKPPVDPSTSQFSASPFSASSLKADLQDASSNASLSSAESAAEKAGHNASAAAKDASGAAKRSTVFSTILHIYRTEGPAALYEGVWGEILKGFLGHGITMIVKEQVHSLIIKTYYWILRALDRYPSPSKLASQAGEAVKEGAEKAGVALKDGYENVSERVGVAGQAVKDGAAQTSDIVREQAEKAGEVLKDGYENVSGRVGDAVQGGKGLAESAGEKLGDAVQGGKAVAENLGEKNGVVGSNVVVSNDTEAAKNAEDLARKEAGHLLGNAQEMLGGKIEGVKPEEN